MKLTWSQRTSKSRTTLGCVPVGDCAEQEVIEAVATQWGRGSQIFYFCSRDRLSRFWVLAPVDLSFCGWFWLTQPKMMSGHWFFFTGRALFGLAGFFGHGGTEA